MALWIKANKKVAEHLKLKSERRVLGDGNYLLWQNDMLKLGRLIDLPEILVRIGGLALKPEEAKMEQDGVVLRELPEAADEAFKMMKDDVLTNEKKG